MGEKRLKKQIVLPEQLGDISRRLDDLHIRADGTNKRIDTLTLKVMDTTLHIDKVKDGLFGKIDNLSKNVDKQFSNHLHEHDQFKKSILKLLKWTITTVLGSGGIWGIIELVNKIK